MPSARWDAGGKHRSAMFSTLRLNPIQTQFLQPLAQFIQVPQLQVLTVVAGGHPTAIVAE